MNVRKGLYFFKGLFRKLLILELPLAEKQVYRLFLNLCLFPICIRAGPLAAGTLE